MKLDLINEAIKDFDEDLDLEDAGDGEFYIFVSSRRRRYYVGCFKLDELVSRKDLIRYLDCISAKEI